MSDAMPVPFVDLLPQWGAIEAQVTPDLHKLFVSGEFCLGSWVQRFEEAFARYLDVPYAIAVNSGTSALHLALIAAGVGPGDRVLLPSHTFVATLWAVLYVGAIPVLCDVDPLTGTLDPEDARRRLQSGAKAIMPVHLYGQPAELDSILALADQHGLTVIEDTAQAHGARYRNRAVGTHGAFGCFSFYPGKNLGAAGEGGMVVTADPKAAEQIRALRNHGQYERWIHRELGFNYRMEGIQGLILGHKLPHLNAWTDARRHVARRYQEGLADLPILLPTVRHHDHVYHLYVIHTPQREALRRFLEQRNIQTGIHYPVPLHRQPCYTALGISAPEGYPHTDRLTEQCLSLPMYAGMQEAQIDAVIAGVRAFFASADQGPT
ncbi:MAG: DegT/DnrJ/EryC1/StrS family aminotransferase [Magnetococcales bacterium]|nr:DegT/DnrJ/EryC1/StrS family aminotransferase [Magnetococcales bacterium]